MRRLVLLFFVLVGLAAAQTTVAETRITVPGGTTVPVLTITLIPVVAFVAADGVRVEQTTHIVTVTNGAFSVVLEPNDTASPANTYYKATYLFSDKTTRKASWIVPTSSSTLRIQDVEQTVAQPALPAGFEVPLTFTSPLQRVGGTVSCVGCGGGGSSGCIHTVAWSATPTFDFSVCTQQVIVLTGNVTPAIANALFCEVAGGCTITFVQGSPAYSVTWASSVTGGFQIGAVATKHNAQTFTSVDGANLIATTPGIVNQ